MLFNILIVIIIYFSIILPFDTLDGLIAARFKRFVLDRSDRGNSSKALTVH